MNSQFYKNMALWFVLLVMILLLVSVLRQGRTTPAEISYSEFIAKVDEGSVREVTIEEGHVNGVMSEGKDFRTFVPAMTQELLDNLKNAISILRRNQPKNHQSGNKCLFGGYHF